MPINPLSPSLRLLCFALLGSPVGGCGWLADLLDPCSGCTLEFCWDGCYSDDDCDDGLFCNGLETCSECFCSAGEPPCSGDGLCGICDEERDMCGECTLDADCQDGLFCNGFERCVDCTCTPGRPACPRIEGCDLCDELTSLCGDVCGSDADCEDGLFCTVDRCDGCGCYSEGSPCQEGTMCIEEARECR